MANDSRPPIPAEVKRRVLVEAGHRCSIPTCRYIEVEIHHIVPWETCQTHEYPNLIALCPNCHSRADRKEIDRKALRIYKSSLRFTHDRFSQFEVDTLFEACKLSHGQALTFPQGMGLLVKRLLDAQFVTLRDVEGGGWSMGMRITPLLLAATERGKAYVSELGLETIWGEDA